MGDAPTPTAGVGPPTPRSAKLLTRLQARAGPLRALHGLTKNEQQREEQVGSAEPREDGGERLADKLHAKPQLAQRAVTRVQKF